MRKILIEASNRITQGTIFSNALCVGYEKAFGLIVTARCDIENHHHTTINYLPIVPLNDWLRKDMIRLLIANVNNNNMNQIESIFKKNKLSYIAAKDIGLNKVVELNIKSPKDKEKIKNADQILSIIGKIKDSIANEDEIEILIKKCEKDVDDILKRLVDNELNSYLYIENCDFYKQQNNETENYVVLLRQFHTIPMNLAIKLKEGIDLNKNKDKKPFFSNDDIALSLSEIKSPYIEYIVQACISQFRIGISRAEYINRKLN